MATSPSPLKPELLRDLFLVKREAAVAKVNAVFDGQLRELCLRTVFPKQVPGFISACLAKRNELETGAGARCLFVNDRATWIELCKSNQPDNRILVADRTLDFDASRNELLPLARAKDHQVIYTLANPRPDRTDVVGLAEPREHEVRDVLKEHGVAAKEAERLARDSNGNIYLLTCLLMGTTGRPHWASNDSGYQLRGLALIGAWNDANARDREAIAEIVGEPYGAWVQRVYPLTKKDEPPFYLEGKTFTPVSRYDTWQQLASCITDEDLTRFGRTAVQVLQEPAAELANLTDGSGSYSRALKDGIAETLALLGAKGHQLPTSPNLAEGVASKVVGDLFETADWKRWATLSGLLPKLAEAAPSRFLDVLESALVNLDHSPLKGVFNKRGDTLSGRTYHAGVLWALEVLAWSKDHLNRVSIALARLARFPLPQNMGNNPLATLRAIFLTWMPQTLAGLEGRKAAVRCVITENREIGWKLLLDILPESHQVGHFNQKPHWRDEWFPEDWSERVTRSELYRQVTMYAELAVELALNDLPKLTDLIARWNNLPREVFQRVLSYLESPEAKSRPDSDRFVLWEKLADQIDRHRKYAAADWAMPEEELRRLDLAAQAIKPADPAVIHQRLFNAHEHEFHSGNDYAAESRRIAERRADAASEIVRLKGASYFLQMAKTVKLPGDLGAAVGQIGDNELDGLIVPALLDVEGPLADLMSGYVWARYSAAGIQWAASMDISEWTSAQVGTFFSRLPFVQAVWRLAELKLGEHRADYWQRVWPNPYQAKPNLLEAAEKSLENGRSDVAFECLGALRHSKEEQVPTALAIAVVRGLLANALALRRVDRHELVEVIGAIQRAPDASESDVCTIEYEALLLLDRYTGGQPQFLERRLANDPSFFHEVITACFRSEHDADKEIEPSSDKKALAERTYHLLHEWTTPPGTSREGELDESAFANWFAEVKRLCEESGHWAIAQQMIGKTLTHAPAGLARMPRLSTVARTLDASEHDHMRRGLSIELYNARGIHSFSGGKDELAIAAGFRQNASEYDLATYSRIAATLRDLADDYERQAKSEADQDRSAP